MRACFRRFIIACVGLFLAPLAWSQSESLQDIARASWRELPEITIYTAKDIVTLDPGRPSANAVAVVGDRILGTGDLESLIERAGDQSYRVDTTFADKVIVPGFIASTTTRFSPRSP